MNDHTPDFRGWQQELFPFGTPSAAGRNPKLCDYALSALDLQLTELERKINVATECSKQLLYIVENPEDAEALASYRQAQKRTG